MDWTSKYDNLDKDFVLQQWGALKKQITFLKEQELDLRKYIVKRAFPDGHEGTNTQELGNGYQLKAGIKFNYSLDKDNQKVEDMLAELARTGNDGSFIAECLVNWSPSFLLTEYRQIEADAADGSELAKQRLGIIARAMTITEAAPTLDIKEPKGKVKEKK